MKSGIFLCRIFCVSVFCMIWWFFPLLLWVFCLLFSHNQKEKFMNKTVITTDSGCNPRSMELMVPCVVVDSKEKSYYDMKKQ